MLPPTTNTVRATLSTMSRRIAVGSFCRFSFGEQGPALARAQEEAYELQVIEAWPSSVESAVADEGLPLRCRITLPRLL